ncbi:MAG: peptide deformylase [Candidatus Moranbacteria bacterium]|nr:peptide deformylase [Candidatus Moranbacteria bacterium]
MLTIVTTKDTEAEILHTPTKKIKEPCADEIKELIKEMTDAMHKANGLGLAAPQVGKNIQLCIIEVKETIHVFINPKITSQSKEKVIFEEGCLSIPGTFIPIIRHEKITVRFTNQNGNAQKIKATGLLAIALQHELDHLNGILIEDRAKTQDTRLLSQLKKQNRYWG